MKKIPRCETCRWWWRRRLGELPLPYREYAPCKRSAGSMNLIPQETADGSLAIAFAGTMASSANLYTTKDFGCVQWQKQKGKD